MLVRTIEVRRSNKGDMDPEVTVIRRTIEAEVDSEWHRSPGRILLPTVEAQLGKTRVSDCANLIRLACEGRYAYPVRWLRSQLLKDLLGLGFRC